LSIPQQKYSVTEIELLAMVETLKEFKGMMWGQMVKVFTGHKNLIRDALGLTSDRVYRWRLILEEYGPEIVYIKGIHNTVADAISRLDYCPRLHDDHKVWMTFTKCWCHYNVNTTPSKTQHTDEIAAVFANHSKEDGIYPLTIKEIAEAQRADKALALSLENDKDNCLLIEDTTVLCKDGKLVIPKSLQHRAVQWYHHYLQHPGNTRLEESLKAVMYWKGMRTTVRSYVKNCRSCQINKRRTLK
jgi:hypothetical protein